jgi:hypothetical protein
VGNAWCDEEENTKFLCTSAGDPRVIKIETGSGVEYPNILAGTWHEPHCGDGTEAIYLLDGVLQRVSTGDVTLSVNELAFLVSNGYDRLIQVHEPSNTIADSAALTPRHLYTHCLSMIITPLRRTDLMIS